jgi:hypothetical protein
MKPEFGHPCLSQSRLCEGYVVPHSAACWCALQGGGGWPSWNWSEFGVAYPSTNSQLCIGGVYVRLLLEGGDPSELA